MKSEKADLPRVGLFVSSWNQYGRGIIEGVWKYSLGQGGWYIDLSPDGDMAPPFNWSGDGIIALVHTPGIANMLQKYNVPLINVSGVNLDGVDIPRVCSDSVAVVEGAVNHLLSKGFKSIAFCGEPHRSFLDFWTDAFVAVTEDEKMERLIYSASDKSVEKPTQKQIRNDHRAWLRSLPKPVGIIGWDTQVCRQLAMACSVEKLNVPEDVAIIALDTDDLLGRVVHPPISGVDIPVQHIGYEAARMLDMQMRGELLEDREIWLPPLGITTRQSSDIFAVDDPQLRKALKYIRDNATEGIDVKDVLKCVPMARRTLERRFNALIGHSPAEEIRRTKIEKVRQLLGETNMLIHDIVSICGFKYVEHMIPIFKKYHNMTPLQYRKLVKRNYK